MKKIVNKTQHYFTKALKQFRDDRDWTQQQLAEYLTLQLGEKIGRVTVALWESQDRGVDGEKAIAIAWALKIEPSELLERKNGED